MSETNRMRCFSLGVLLIIVGIAAALNTMCIWDFEINYDDWWTLFIIVSSVAGLLCDKDKIGSLIFLSIGIYLLLAVRDIIEYTMFFSLFVPTLTALPCFPINRPQTPSTVQLCGR